jgi:hypothetical protein
MVRRYLDTSDAKSTSNLRKHARLCWGVETVAAADETRNLGASLDLIKTHKDGSITEAFERKGKGKVTYSHRQHTTTQVRCVYVSRRPRKHINKLINSAEIVRWVAESKRPFNIVNDRGFQSLMKTGRPDYHLPSDKTISRDTKQTFVHARKRVATMLQKYEGQLNYATDAWTSPNHKAFVAFTVHFAHEGTPVSMLLDLVEVAMSHSGVNLAAAFAKVLEDFGISDKVWLK